MFKGIQNWFEDFVEYIQSFRRKATAIITGCTVTAIIGIFFGLNGKMEPWMVWTLVGLAFFVAAFYPWRENKTECRRLSGRLQPKLKLHCSPDFAGCIDDNGFKTASVRVLRIVVESDSDMDVEDCKGVLTKISKNGKILWGGKTANLTFQPSDRLDTDKKCITPNTSQFLDVIFLDFDGDKLLRIKPGTKNHDWYFLPSFEDIFSENGEYELEIRVEAKHMQAIHTKSKFTFKGVGSTLEFARI